MARSRSSRAERDTTDIASTDLDELLSPVSRPPVSTLPTTIAAASVLPDLPAVADLRLWSPEEVRPALQADLVPARIVHEDSLWRPDQLDSVPVGGVQTGHPPSFSFASPAEVFVCARRKARREVLFALGRRNRGRGGKRRRNEFTEVSCSR